LGGEGWKDLDDAFKKVTTPAGAAVVLQQHRNFSPPIHPTHNPPEGTPEPPVGHTTMRGQHLTEATKTAATTSSFTPANPSSLPALLPQPRAGTDSTSEGLPMPSATRSTSRQTSRERTRSAAQVRSRSGPWAQIWPSCARAAGEQSAHARAPPPQLLPTHQPPTPPSSTDGPASPNTTRARQRRRPPPPLHATTRPAPLPHAKHRRRQGRARRPRRQGRAEAWAANRRFPPRPPA
jgi:hypothetical protein